VIYHIEYVGGVYLVKDQGGTVAGTYKTKGQATAKLYNLSVSENGYNKGEK
jgi:hypothetical protein